VLTRDVQSVWEQMNLDKSDKWGLS
jgi:hypothetical protein